jgi:hypothetical protein
MNFLPSEDSPSIISCFDMSSPIRSKDPTRESTAPVSCLNVRDPRNGKQFFLYEERYDMRKHGYLLFCFRTSAAEIIL